MRFVTSRAAAVRSIMVQDSRIALRIVQTWLLLGSIALLCVPALRGTSEWFGWLPFWLMVAPLADLLILRWRDVVGVSRATFAQARRRRSAARRSTSAQARLRRVRTGPVREPRGKLLTALLGQ